MAGDLVLIVEDNERNRKLVRDVLRPCPGESGGNAVPGREPVGPHLGYNPGGARTGAIPETALAHDRTGQRRRRMGLC
jgi:CheY-like chemotaxis protein